MSKKGFKPLLVITAGDPAGIGPEVTMKALQAGPRCAKADIVLVGPIASFRRYSGTLRLRAAADEHDVLPEFVNVIDIGTVRFRPGKPTPETARASWDALERAVALVKKHERAALVTGPIYKKGLQDIGFPFPGHTEFLGKRFKAVPLMMFHGRKLKVATLTTHLPLVRVAAGIRGDRICGAVSTAAGALSSLFSMPNPAVAVLGLNPHAGEEGRLGREETEIIGPACARLRKDGFNVHGPLPADVALHHALAGRYDFVLGMYHDQVLASFKMLYFESGVNVTLGLPVIRTSPDHGTAFDIAGKGVAAENSMKQAIELAARMAGNRRKNEDKIRD